MEREPMPCKLLAQYAEDPLGIEHVLERHDGIVSEAVHLPLRRGRTSCSNHSSSTW
jgi:hypothetical protein